MGLRKALLALIALLVVGAALVLFWPTESDPVTPIPLAPATITDLGRYSLGEGRFIEVSADGSNLHYSESEGDELDPNGPIIQHVTYVTTEVPSVRLSDGWSIEFSPPDNIKIHTGRGETLERQFGDDEAHVPLVGPTGSVVRTPANNRKAEQDSGGDP